MGQDVPTIVVATGHVVAGRVLEMSEMATLSMIVKNEASNLPKCLARARCLVDEMVVVDTGSSDATVEIALAAGARVEHFKWIDDFSAARNFANDCSRTPYVLVLDADEWFAEKDIPALLAEMAACMAQGKALVTMNRSYVPTLSVGLFQLTGEYPDDEMGVGYLESLRAFLFPKTIRYHGCVHENPGVDVCGAIWTKIPMHHSGHMDKVRTAAKGGYYELGLKKLKQLGDGYLIREELGKASHACGLYEAAKDHWMRAISFIPTSPAAHMGFASALVGLGRYGQARQAARRAVKLAPSSIDAVRLLAWVELFCGNAQACVELCGSAFKMDPARPHSLMLGIIAMMALDGNPAGLSVLSNRMGLTNVEASVAGFARLLISVGQPELGNRLAGVLGRLEVT